MAPTGSNADLKRLLLREAVLMEGRNRTPPALKLQQVRKDVLSLVKDAGKNADIDRMLFVERVLLTNDLEAHANSGAMKSSLEIALAELTAAERLIGKVRSPEAYRETDAAHSLPKNRIGDVPRDEARQFFNSHTTRLVNWDKSRLDVEEKKIVDARKQNMRSAGKTYAAMQRQALGLSALGSSKEQSQGLEL